jgi:hypothetical protein
MKWTRVVGNRLIHNYLRKKSFIRNQHPTSTHTVALLFSLDASIDKKVILSFAKEIEKSTSYKPYLLGFVNKHLNSNVKFTFPHFSLSDLGLIPLPKDNKDVSLFMQRSYEILINLDQHHNEVLHYLSHKIQAQHKIGVNPLHQKLYDIVIEKEEGLDFEGLVEKTLNIFGKIF